MDLISIKEKEAVNRVIDSKVLSGYRGSYGPWFYGGPEVKALEQEWADKFKVKHAIFVNSATSGLRCAMVAIGMQLSFKDKAWETETIVSPYSMTCSASMPLHFCSVPVFCDIEKDYFCIDADRLDAKITKRTKAIIVVDLFGMPYDADRINAIAAKYHIPVIEDAAQAIGAKYKGKYAGTLGTIGVYSLNVHKHIQCGEGGIIVTDNDDLAMRVRLAMNHAEAVNNDMKKAQYNLITGMNLRMTELQAAVTREQLKKLDSIIKKYQELAKNFDIPIREKCTSSYYKFASLNMPKNPDKKLFDMKDHYITPLYRLPLFRELGYAQNLCPVCEEVESKIKLAWLREVI